MPPASIFAVEILFAFAAGVLLAAHRSMWGIAVGGLLLFASIGVAVRYRITFRSLFRRPSEDDPHKLYNSRKA